MSELKQRLKDAQDEIDKLHDMISKLKAAHEDAMSKLRQVASEGFVARKEYAMSKLRQVASEGFVARKEYVTNAM